MKARVVVGLVVISTMACSRREAPTIAPVHESKDAPQGSTLPIVRTWRDVETFDRQRAIVLGTYEVELVHVHQKGGRMTSIVLADGTHVSRAYGAVAAEYPFVGKRVRVIGIVSKGPDDEKIQAIGGPHVKLESIALAEGETPTVPTPTALPTPPMVSTTPGFAPHVHRWVAVNGTVDSASITSGPWGVAVLKLGDGGLVDVGEVLVSDWTPMIGKSITVVGRVHLEATDAAIGMRVTLHGAGLPCVGVVPRCGVDDPL